MVAKILVYAGLACLTLALISMLGWLIGLWPAPW
jgi:hypothetical protein